MMRDTFKRHWRLISFVLGIIVLFWLLYALRGAILPFVVGLVLAYLLKPLLLWLERKLPSWDRWQQTKRVSLIILIFVVLVGLVGFLAYFVITAVVDASLVLINNAPQYLGIGLHALQQWFEVFREQMPAEVRTEIDSFLVEVGVTLGNAVKSAFMGGVSRIPSAINLVFGFVTLPIFLFYILKDSEKLRRDFYAALPSWVAEHTRNVAKIIENVLGRYIRAQLLLGLIVAYFSFVGLLFLRVPFAAALAVFAGITELIPVVGPWIGGAAAVVVTLAIMPEKAIWVAVLFLVIQLLENALLVPRIQGSYLKINPGILVVLLVMGAYVAGFWGLLLAAPLTATAIALYKYVRERMQLEKCQ
jgi:predicted PurR-regulated permease PerM